MCLHPPDLDFCTLEWQIFSYSLILSWAAELSRNVSRRFPTLAIVPSSSSELLQFRRQCWGGAPQETRESLDVCWWAHCCSEAAWPAHKCQTVQPPSLPFSLSVSTNGISLFYPESSFDEHFKDIRLADTFPSTEVELHLAKQVKSYWEGLDRQKVNVTIYPLETH